jgi:hypothetical protein
MAYRLAQRILVPVLGDDISSTTLAYARSALAATEARLAILFIAPPSSEGGEGGGGDAPVVVQVRRAGAETTPRWRQLAAAAPEGRVFVDAVEGEAVAVILSQAERFHSDLVLLGRPAGAGRRGAWASRLTAPLRHAGAPVKVLAERPPAGARPARARARRPRLQEASC